MTQAQTLFDANAGQQQVVSSIGESKEDKVFLIREEEEPTLDGLHEICQIIGPASGKGLHWVPLMNPRRVLDLGSGTGQWIKEFVKFYDVEKVVGLDLESPRSVDLPPNSSFITGDLEKPWPFTEKFDFIHARFLAGCIENWPRFFQQCYENLQPGGYFEIVDILIVPTSEDASLSPTSHTVSWNKLIAEVSASLGRPLLITAQYSTLAKNAGFEEVREAVRNVPGKAWGEDGVERRLGSLSRDVHATVSERLGIDMLVKGMGWGEQEVRGRLEGVFGELDDERVHTTWPFYAVVGKKPLDG